MGVVHASCRWPRWLFVVVLLLSACSSGEPNAVESSTPPIVGSDEGDAVVLVDDVGDTFGGSWGHAPTTLGASELGPLLVPFDDRVFVLYTQNGGLEVAGEMYDPASDAVEPMADSGHGWRYNPAVAWTGSELLVVGGSSGPAIDDLALAYDPDADHWRTLPNPPGDVDALQHSVGGPGAWTGDELLIWQDGLAYDPSSEAWRTVTHYPGPRRAFPAVAWTGDELIVWGGCDASIPQCDDLGRGLLDDGLIYDLETDKWRAMPPSPLAVGVHPVAVVADDAVLFYAGKVGAGRVGAQAARYDPATEEWTEFDPPPVEPRRYAAAAWTGHHFVVWGGEKTGETWHGDGAALDPDTNRWELLPEPPPGSERDRHAMTWTGDHLYIVGGWATNGPITFTPDG